MFGVDSNVLLYAVNQDDRRAVGRVTPRGFEPLSPG